MGVFRTLLLSVLFTSIPAGAGDVAVCTNASSRFFDPKFEAVLTDIPTAFNSVFASDVAKAPCKGGQTPDAKTLESMYSAGTSPFHLNTIAFPVQSNGFTFIDENSKNIGLLKQLAGELEFTPKDGCNKVLCAAKQIFGDSEGPKLLYLLDQFGFNGSQYQTHPTYKGRSTAWKNDDLDFIIETMGDLPKTMFPLVRNSPFILDMKQSSDQAVTKDYGIMLSSLFYSRPRNNYRATVTHELGHYFADSKLDRSPQWLAIENWKQVKKIDTKGKATIEWERGNPGNFLGTYAMTNPDEDFAESFSAYRYAPEKLKAAAPLKYEFMKKYVFLGAEYLNEDTCKSDDAIAQGLNLHGEKYLAIKNRRENWKEDINSSCHLLLTNSLMQTIEGSSHAFSSQGAELASCEARAIQKAANVHYLSAGDSANTNLYKLSPMFNSLPPSESARKISDPAKMRSDYVQALTAAYQMQEENTPRRFGTSTESHCKSLRSYAYQSFDKVMKQEKYMTASENSYRHEKQLSDFMEKICLKNAKDKASGNRKTVAQTINDYL